MSLLGKYAGRTGNHLFNYWVRRMYSESRGLYLPPANIAWFEKTYSSLNGKENSNNTKVEYRKTRVFENPDIVFSDFDKLGLDRDIIINQNLGFNYSEWLSPNLATVKNLYSYSEPNIDIDYENTTIYNIRIGDFVKHKKVIDMNFYKSYIEKDVRNKLIITDDKDHEFIKQLGIPVFQSTNPKEHFSVLKNCSYIIGSNSTFFFWAMYLNEKLKKCVWPITTNGSYAAFSLTKIIKHNMDMRVDKNTFHYVYNVPYFSAGDNNDWGILKTGINNIENFHKHSTYEVLK